MLLPLHLRTGARNDPHPDVYLVVMALKAILAILEYYYSFRLNKSHILVLIISLKSAYQKIVGQKSCWGQIFGRQEPP